MAFLCSARSARLIESKISGETESLKGVKGALFDRMGVEGVEVLFDRMGVEGVEVTFG